MIVEILVAESDRKHPLAHQRRHAVLDQVRLTYVVETPCKSIDHSDRSIRRSQQQRSRIRRHQAAIERGFHRAIFDISKIKAFRATLCRHRGSRRIPRKSLQHNNFR